MKRVLSPSGYPFVAVLCTLILLAAGCASPDRWRVFDSPPSAVREASDPLPLTMKNGVKAGDLTVEEAVMTALQTNRDLKVRRLGPLTAGAFEQIERGIYDPELFAEARYVREEAEGEESEGFVAAGIRQALPSGTALEASLEYERVDTGGTPDEERARIGLSVTQALLQGRGSEVNMASVRQAGLERLASRYELRGFTEALMAEVETAYWNYVLADREIEIFESSLAVARQQRNEVEEQIEVGLLPPIDAAAVRAEVARREQGLILAESLLVERRLLLMRLLGHDPSEPSVPAIHAISDPRTEPSPISDVSDRIRLAVQLRADLGEARLRLEQERLETMVTGKGLLPRLELFLTLGGTGYAESFFGSFGELNGDTYDFTAGVRFTRLLGNRSAWARDLAARTSHRMAAESIENLEQIVRFDVRLAVSRAESSRRQIAASAATRIFQEETLKAEQERFAVGAGTGLMVAQAQRDLLVSQIAEIRSIVNYRIALTELHRAEGSLLERRGIQLDGGPLSPMHPPPSEH